MLKIRKAVETDFEGWRTLFQEIHDDHLKAQPWFFDQPSEETLYEMYQLQLKEENGAVFVAETDQRLIGYACVIFRQTSDAPILRKRQYLVLDTLVVTKAERRKGVGKALVDAAKRFARENDGTDLELSVWDFNQGAVAFYESIGFKTLTRRMRITFTPEL